MTNAFQSIFNHGAKSLIRSCAVNCEYCYLTHPKLHFSDVAGPLAGLKLIGFRG